MKYKRDMKWLQTEEVDDAELSMFTITSQSGPQSILSYNFMRRMYQSRLIQGLQCHLFLSICMINYF